MKTCKNCLLEKDLSMFYGIQGECKECTKKRVKANLLTVGKSYDFSEKGIIRVMYKTQKRNQKLRGHGDMPYSKVEFHKWCKLNGFDDLYTAWVESGHSNDLKPSADRIDDFAGYSLCNIKLGTWRQNRQHQFDDIRNGTGTSGLKCKPVLKIDSHGNTICRYKSFSEAKRVEGYHMEYPIKKGTKCKNGFYWKYI